MGTTKISAYLVAAALSTLLLTSFLVTPAAAVFQCSSIRNPNGCHYGSSGTLKRLETPTTGQPKPKPKPQPQH